MPAGIAHKLYPPVQVVVDLIPPSFQLEMVYLKGQGILQPDYPMAFLDGGLMEYLGE